MQILYQTVKPFDKLLKKQKVKPGQQYRPMYYVVEQSVDEGLLLYHNMTRALLLLTPEEAKIYKSHPTDLPQLIEQWYLVPESHDDRLLSRQIRDVARMLKTKSDAITSYTILPTTDCNARCFYCFEKGRSRIPMSSETALQTADYIISHCQRKKVSLHWFGGEPLYNKSVITLICQRLKDAGIEYTSRMTSNGYLFDDDTIKEAKDLWNLKKVQITLDGTEKIYNRSKAYIYKGVNAYKRVIENIHRLKDANIRVSIRLNIDMHNANNLLELVDELHRDFYDPKGISVYIHTLFEETKGSQALHNEQKRNFVFGKILEIEKRLIDYGFSRLHYLNREVRTNLCMADNANSVVIVPNGSIGKCEHYTEDHFIGHIRNAEWDAQMIEDFQDTREEIDACTTCFNYPDCIWLKLCEDKPNCYHEERDHHLFKLRQSILSTYHNNKEKLQDETQD